MSDEPTDPGEIWEGLDPEEETLGHKFVRVAPGLARIGAAAWWRTTGWAVAASARATGSVAKGAVSGENPAELFERTGAELRDYARRLLGMLDEGAGEGPGRRGSRPVAPGRAATDGDMTELRDRGTELLRRSADVAFEEQSHPAYARILEQLAPDEARILRLLAVEGAQPAVDVRNGIPVVPGGSELIAAGLSMIGPGSGARHLERIPAYLNNLFRLGLVWFSREPLHDPRSYLVLEAQPEVTDALSKAGRTGRTVRRSVLLTPFGEDFCHICLPLDGIDRRMPGVSEDGGPGEPSDLGTEPVAHAPGDDAEGPLASPAAEAAQSEPSPDTTA